MLSVMMNHQQSAKQNRKGLHAKHIILTSLIADKSKLKQKRRHDA